MESINFKANMQQLLATASEVQKWTHSIMITPTCSMMNHILFPPLASKVQSFQPHNPEWNVLGKGKEVNKLFDVGISDSHVVQRLCSSYSARIL